MDIMERHRMIESQVIQASAQKGMVRTIYGPVKGGNQVLHFEGRRDSESSDSSNKTAKLSFSKEPPEQDIDIQDATES
jgi:hypothetical protein